MRRYATTMAPVMGGRIALHGELVASDYDGTVLVWHPALACPT